MRGVMLKNGTVEYYTPKDLEEAYIRNMDQIFARMDGREPPPPHRLQLALLNAAMPRPWHETYIDGLEDCLPVPDLSED
jgi:hypothetical protein